MKLQSDRIHGTGMPFAYMKTIHLSQGSYGNYKPYLKINKMGEGGATNARLIGGGKGSENDCLWGVKTCLVLVVVLGKNIPLESASLIGWGGYSY